MILPSGPIRAAATGSSWCSAPGLTSVGSPSCWLSRSRATRDRPGLLLRAFRLAPPGENVHAGHDDGARIVEMLAHGPVHLIELAVIGEPQLDDHRPHAAHQVRPQRAARVAGRVDRGPHLDADLLQASPAVQLAHTAADERIRAVPAEG